MTCIVGLVAEDGTVYMGGDSAAVQDWMALLTLPPGYKVWQTGPLLIGASGTCRIGQILRHQLAIPPLPTDGDWGCWVATSLTEAIRNCLKDAGHAKKEAEQERAGGNELLIGVAGRLFGLYDDYGLLESAAGYLAGGCGWAIASGSLHSTQNLLLAPEDRVRWALEAAEAHNPGVRGPFTILHLDPPPELGDADNA